MLYSGSEREIDSVVSDLKVDGYNLNWNCSLETCTATSIVNSGTLMIKQLLTIVGSCAFKIIEIIAQWIHRTEIGIIRKESALCIAFIVKSNG